MEEKTIQFSPIDIEERQKLGIRAGDTVRVWVKVREKDKTRLQVFEGLVLARKHGNEPGATFTVRKIASRVGVERIFPLYSPVIDKIEILKRSRVRRSKLYYVREKVAREIRRQMRKMKLMHISTKSDLEEADRAKKEAEAKAKTEKEVVKEEEKQVAKEKETEAEKTDTVKVEAEKSEETK
ncbi:MAG: 50S ribosomal protein L19 [Candidatus Pacebacteria bacterium]|nr:50S ribosomal protein L19 [Candidatus Paceibacterota bacterium]